MEPPRPGLPARARPPLLITIRPRPRPLADVSVGRVALLAAAFVLAVSSRGDVVVLAVLLALGAGRRAPAVAIATALAAAMVRWGTPWLGGIAGAQAVLGPAGWTGSAAAVASAWCGAVAVTLAAVDRDERHRLLARVAEAAPFAATAADLVVGPSAGGGLVVRIAGTVVASAAIVVLPRAKPTGIVAVLLGVVALVAASVSR